MTYTTMLASSGTNYTAIGILLAIFVPICAAVAVIVWNYYRLQRHRSGRGGAGFLPQAGRRGGG